MTLDEFIAQGIEDRAERISAVGRYTEENPQLDGNQLERLADYILREELTDTDRMKSRNNEYPFMSERQIDRRRAEEVPLKVAEEVGIDGRNYREPVKRKRTFRENLLSDKYAKSRNKERRAKYRAFTEEQPITGYVASPDGIEEYLAEKYPHKRLI